MKDDIILAEVDGEGMMIDVEGGTSHFLNETGLLIYKMLKDEKSDDEIIDFLLEEYDIEKETVEKDIHEFREKLERKEVSWGKKDT